MSETPTERIRKELERNSRPNELYSEIRRRHTIEALGGKRWIIIVNNIPVIVKITTKEVILALSYIEKEDYPSLSKIKVHDILNLVSELTAIQFLDRYRHLV